MISIKNPYLLAGAGLPLATSVLTGTDTSAADNVRRATGLAALVATGVWAWTGSTKAQNAAVGTGAAWAALKLGLL